MSARTFVERMRARQAADFTDACQITRRSTTEPTFNPTTLRHTLPAPTAVYTGPCLVRDPSVSTADVGGEQLDVGEYLIKLPADTAVEIGDFVAITASTLDAGLAGTTLVARRVLRHGWQVCRRVVCEEQSS